MEWFPIETAPKEKGARVLIYWQPMHTAQRFIDIGELDLAGYLWKGEQLTLQWHVVDDQCGGTFPVHATHWMPLPAPPSLGSDDNPSGQFGSDSTDAPGSS